MIKGKHKIVNVLVFAIIAVICFALPLVTARRTSAEYAVETSETVRESYMLGEKFVIPDGELVLGENRYRAEQSMLVFPDGTIKTGKEQVLSQKGCYSLLYAAKIGQEEVTAKKEFSVAGSYYSFSGDAAENAGFEYTDNFNMAPESNLSGIRLQIPKGTMFNVNEVFDVSELTENNPVITIYPYNNTFLMNKNGKTVQANDIKIILTDYYDPTNFIVLDFHWVAAEYTSPLEYASKLNYWAGVGDSALYGMVRSATGSIEYDGEKYSKQATYYGVSAYYMRSDVWIDAEGNAVEIDAALPDGAIYSRSVGFSYYYDHETMSVYASDTNDKKFVSNLGLKSLYGDKAFKGFTGDKFFLSICVDDYRTSSGSSIRDLVADMEISNILGRTGNDLFVEEAPKDETAPYIEVKGTDRTLVAAKGEKIELPSPIVKDINLKSVVSTVYFGYGTSQQTLVAIEDGAFIPNRLGLYTIMYVAADTFGNVSTVRLDIRCKSFPDNRSLRIEMESIDAPEAGTIFTLPKYRLLGENAGKTAQVFYAYGDEEFKEIDESGTFFIDHVGKYTIRFEYSDMLVSYTDEYEFVSVGSDHITFSTVTLPKYLVKGSTYTLENLCAFKYDGVNPRRCDVITYVSEDNAPFKEIDANAYIVQANDSVQFKYVLDGDETYSDFVPVIDVKNGDGELVMPKHFVTSDFDCEEQIDKLVFIPKTYATNVMEFVNPISVSNFYLELCAPEGYANYESVGIKLTDYYDRNKAINIVYQRYMVYNAKGDFYSYALSCNGKTYRNYEKLFEGNLMQVYCRSGKIFAGGAVFDIEGVLSADKALLTLSMNKAVVEESKLELSKLNNVVLGDVRYDDTRPQLYYKKDCALYEPLGAEITVYPADATDVLSAFVIGNLEMYVKGPNNSSVTAIDGTVLDSGIDVTKPYTFRLEQNGVYTVYYKYRDTNGNVMSQNYKIYILDGVAPTLTLDGGYNENTLVTAEYGKSYTVQTCEVADAVTSSENLLVSVIAEAPNGSMSPVKDGKIVFATKGRWKIYYYCMDETGNTSMTYYTVDVK